MYDKLRTILAERGLTVRQLALESGIIEQNLYAALNGNSKFWPGWKVRVAAVLELPVNEVFPEEEKNENS